VVTVCAKSKAVAAWTGDGLLLRPSRFTPGGFLPRIVLTFDFDHASRAKGEWSDPARVVHNSPRAGPLHCWISLASLRVLSNPLSRVMFRNKTLDHFRFAIGP